MLVVDGDPVEVHEQVERDVGLQIRERLADRTEVAADAELHHLVAELFEGRDHVDLGAKVGELLVR